jgi:hypothetical protein
LARVTFKAALNRAETSSLAANLSRVAAELRRSLPFRGLLALRCSRKIQQVERFKRDKRRAAISSQQIQLPREAVIRGSAACVVDAPFAVRRENRMQRSTCARVAICAWVEH